jgi:hypothetical protein
MTTESGYDDKAYDARMTELCVSRQAQAFEWSPHCLSQTDGSLCCSNKDGEEFFKEWTESVESFDQMGLHDSLLRGIYAYGALPARRPAVV